MTKLIEYKKKDLKRLCLENFLNVVKCPKCGKLVDVEYSSYPMMTLREYVECECGEKKEEFHDLH